LKDTTFYVQLSPKWNSWDKNRLEGIALARATQKKPDKPVPGTITVKLTLALPDDAFKPYEPVVKIEIPENQISQNIQLKVEEPDVQDVQASE
jgi:hypothetical protein